MAMQFLTNQSLTQLSEIGYRFADEVERTAAWCARDRLGLSDSDDVTIEPCDVRDAAEIVMHSNSKQIVHGTAH